MDGHPVPPKLCVECLHHKSYRLKGGAVEKHVCLLRLYEVKINPVTGARSERHTNCDYMRRKEALCGIEAKYYAPLAP